MSAYHDAAAALLDAARAQQGGTPEPAPVATEGVFDPSKHNVDDVLAYVDAHPDEAQAVLDAEVDGKNRAGVVNALAEADPE